MPFLPPPLNQSKAPVHFTISPMPPVGIMKPTQSYQQQQQTAAHKKLARPRGLWKARGTQAGGHAALLSPHSNRGTPARSPTPAFSSDYPHLRHHPRHPANGAATDYFDSYYSSDDSSFSSRASSPGVITAHSHHSPITSLSTTIALTRPRKRRRVSSSTTPPSSASCCSECEEEQIIYWDYARSKACAPVHHRQQQSSCGADMDAAADSDPERARESKWTTRSKLMDTTSIGISAKAFVARTGYDLGMGTGYGIPSPPVPPAPQASFDLEDWEDLKELFAKTAEMYETHPPEETLPLLRGVIHECHRFMLAYPDPSILYTTPPHSDSAQDPSSHSHSHEHHHTHHHHGHGPYYYYDKGKKKESNLAIPIPVEWITTDPPPLYPPPDKQSNEGEAQAAALTNAGIQADPASEITPATSSFSTVPYSSLTPAPSTSTAPAPPKKCKCKDLPTAFYTILGTTLFFFGTIIQSHPSLALEGEPAYPTPYWLSALDVFEIGEGLPVRVSGRGRGVPPPGYEYAHGVQALSSGLSGLGTSMGGGWYSGYSGSYAYSGSPSASAGGMNMIMNSGVAWGCGNGPPEDWRMAVMWGRTLVCIADEVLRREREAEKRREVAEMGAAQHHYHHHQQERSSYFSGFPSPPLPTSYVSTSASSTAGATSPPISFTSTPSSIHPGPFTSNVTSLSQATAGTPFSQISSTTFSASLLPATPAVPQLFASEPDDPAWPPNSPFAAIIARRPPMTTRVSVFSGVSPAELLQLAQDQFSRGILHMPHLQHLAPRLFRQASFGGSGGGLDGGRGERKGRGGVQPPVAISAVSSTSTAASATTSTSSQTQTPSQTQNPNSISTHLPSPSTFSRAKELCNIASAVLLLAEKLPSRKERQVWAGWADSVLSQMKMELESTAAAAGVTHTHASTATSAGGGGGPEDTVMVWRGVIWAARGRAGVVVGSALAEGVEERLEQEGEGHEERQREILECEDARDARDVLSEAVGYLERAKEEVEERRKERLREEERQRRERERERERDSGGGGAHGLGHVHRAHVHRHRVHVREEEHEREEDHHEEESEEMVISLEEAEGEGDDDDEEDDEGDVTIIPEEDEEMQHEDAPSPSGTAATSTSTTTARPTATTRITIAPPLLPSSSTGAPSASASAPAPTAAELEEEDLEELRTLLAEALLSLANLTADERERERLYERAKREGGDKVVFDDDDNDDDESEEGDRMDESG